MKTLLTTLILTATIATAGEYADVISNKYYPAIPKRIQATQNPTAAQLAARGIYPTTRKPLPEGHRYLANDFRLENGRAVDYTPTINKAEEWAAANQKNPSQLGNETEFMGMIKIIKGSVPIEKGSLRQLMDKAEAYIDGLPEANKPKARDKLDRLALLYQELKSDGVLYEAHLGRQITAGDYPQ